MGNFKTSESQKSTMKSFKLIRARNYVIILEYRLDNLYSIIERTMAQYKDFNDFASWKSLDNRIIKPKILNA